MPLTCLYHKCDVNGKGNANAKEQGDHKSASIAQWLEHRQSNPVVTGSSPGGDGHICACHVKVRPSMSRCGGGRWINICIV